MDGNWANIHGLPLLGRIPLLFHFSFYFTSSPLDLFCSLTIDTFTVFLISPNLITLKNIYTLKTLTLYFLLCPLPWTPNSQPCPRPSSAPPTDFPNAITRNSIILVAQPKNLSPLDCLLLQPASNLTVNLDWSIFKIRTKYNQLSYIHSFTLICIPSIAS